MNPLLRPDVFVPDAEARVMPDGRLYLYGSWDIGGARGYCSDRYHVFSTADLRNWTDHGVAFTAAQIGGGCALFAPDCIHRDGKYYLYYCTSSQGEGAAVSDCPSGPFQDLGRIKYADGDGIDPAVFIDDDGQAYYLWGQFRLRGAKLNADMRTLEEGSITTDILTEWEHGFHEGASLRRRGDKYYLIYTDITRGRATALSYGWSHSPLGPYKKGGVIIDNLGCDPQTWNNHGSIAEFRGQWMIFYHRSSQNSPFSRRVCAEFIYFDEDGLIREVPMTSGGVTGPLDGSDWISAAAACRLKTPFLHEPTGIHIAPEVDGELLTGLRDGDWAEYRTVKLPKGICSVSVKARAAVPCTLEFFTDGGQSAARVPLEASARWQEYTAPASAPAGEVTLTLRSAGSMADVHSFMFSSSFS